jgi:hypothetical protein
MKIFGSIVFGLGFLLVTGTAGASDFYEECLAAADCVAGAPMSDLRMMLQLLAGVATMVTGICLLSKNSEF